MTVVAAERRRSILIATCTALMAVVASASGSTSLSRISRWT
ncbi:MAG TPA: hypothetical protein VK501_00390 [Baekduia sp.]|nr:hypothetical protein [Baekduia sp.]HMJ32343.1 hypothetical protein [Baekduia sp.]